MHQELSSHQMIRRGATALWSNPIMRKVLWVVQVCLALFFLYGGLIKLVPPDALPGAGLIAWLLSPLPKWLVLFTGVTEMLGGLGLILPSRLGILPMLTPLAALGLILEMIGATIFIPLFYPSVFVAGPVMTALFLAFVGAGCWWRQRHGFI